MDYFRAGGVRAVIAELIGAGTLPHPDALTVNGRTIRENCEGRLTEDREVIRAYASPMLEDAGFVEGLDTGEGGKRFEHILGHAHHDHMLCQVCGKILEFQDAELEKRKEAVARAQGFRLLSHSLKLNVECLDPGCEGRFGRTTPEEPSAHE